MQTSDSTPQKTRSIGRWATTVLVLVAIVAVVNIALCFILEPYGGHTETVWTEYRSAADQPIDTVFVGSSTTAYALDPLVFDEQAGTHSFNLSTPGQSFDNTLMTLEAAHAEHGITRAVMFVGHEAMVVEPYINSAVAVTQAKCQGEDPVQALRDIGRLMFDKAFFSKHYSLTCLFPWTYNHVEYTAEDIASNVSNRLTCNILEASARYSERVKDSEWRYRSQGFGSVHTSMYGLRLHGQVVVAHPGQPVAEVNYRDLERICAFCKQNGIELYVVGAPYTYSAVRAYGEDYRASMTRVRDTVLAAGAHYFDLNMIHRDVLNLERADYCDYVHLGELGAPKATATVAQLIGRIETGEDVSELFYDYTDSGWQSFIDSADFVDSLDYSCELDDNLAQITVLPVTGSNTPAEYRVEMYDPDSDGWSTVREWNSSDTFSIDAPQGAGTMIRIYAHSTTGAQDADRWCEGPLT